MKPRTSAEIKREPADEQQPHRDDREQQRAAWTVLERLRGGLRSDWSGHVLRQMSRGPMRRIDVRGDRLFSLCGHQRDASADLYPGIFQMYPK
jgi:hypothetical protein